MADFVAERIERGDEITLALSGELDLVTVNDLVRAAGAVPANASLTLDLTNLAFVDSSGLRVFMNFDRRARREGWTLSIRNPRGQVLRLLELCGFHERLPVTDSGSG